MCWTWVQNERALLWYGLDFELLCCSPEADRCDELVINGWNLLATLQFNVEVAAAAGQLRDSAPEIGFFKNANSFQTKQKNFAPNSPFSPEKLH